jgi:hypothetical protein
LDARDSLEANKCRPCAQPILAAAKPSGAALPTLADRAELLVSDLVTNAIRASGGLTLGMMQKSERQSRMGYDRPMWRDLEREAV